MVLARTSISSARLRFCESGLDLHVATDDKKEGGIDRPLSHSRHGEPGMDDLDSLQLTMQRYDLAKSQAMREVHRYDGELQRLRSEEMVMDQVSTLFRYLMRKEIYEHAERFSDIVTQGLMTIFHDQNLSFRVEVEEKRGKVSVKFLTMESNHEGDPLKAFGGGVAAIESLLLRLMVLKRQGLAPYLFLDESLAALSEEYVPVAAMFLKELCKRFGVNLLLITHNKAFQEYADHVYLAVPEEDHTTIQHVR